MRIRVILFVGIFSFSTIFAQSIPLLQQNDKPRATKESLKKRRNLLEWHQIAGLTTLALWLATNLEGDKASETLYRKSDQYAQTLLLANPQYASNDPMYLVAMSPLNRHSIAADYFLLKDPTNNAGLYLALKANEEWETKHSAAMHKNLAMATFSMYAITASLAFFSPSKIESESENEEDGPRIYSPILAHKAMIPIHLASMLLLPGLGARIEKEGPRAAHQMEQVGWTGFGAMSIALLVITF
ncbi:hypothetical protein [Leptospira mtsangambouensis]|uniref:hypothetical protein n=1 Tax=Leptospira mtsangambouensis TaxID=2484912 RepID=UPI001EECEBD8|nr:hypothetical protein [Leptospira mtsangambouensis]MCG6138976.1 hypothetical protein [Leptospira mtsangambouensis]